ncbi:MAG: glycoside hydrolase family 32 protein [Bilifractor sp.]|nr:glycoside hydrolase family 32 protein [Lachnospiraceae bacterium]MDY2837704.1 glycoside hydrolase family 32 protein [Bilifractor sp.]
MLRDKNGWRLQYHLMPPDGWLNDPNGLCQFQGVYHIFFQYSPNTPGPDGRFARTWGHYAGRDLLHLKYTGVPFWPVDPIDRDGCYSGSALTDDEHIRLYYTGNVKESGNHDYTYSGRQANEILVESDGENFSEKTCLLTNSDYPKNCTCHVRDPKVWKKENGFYMILGARVKGPDLSADSDFGEVLFYQSEDGIHWNFLKSLTSEERFGYMWECPDYFTLSGKTFLSLCPQGLPKGEYRYQNIYQAGYFTVEGSLDGVQYLHDFREWDYGFDFYAPQSFVDEQGRRLFIGWVGMPDAPYTNPTAEPKGKGWENCLTVPRELSLENGTIRQNPIAELKNLRYDETPVMPHGSMVLPDGAGDFEISLLEGTEDLAWDIYFGDGAVLSYREDLLRLNFTDSVGFGRRERRVIIPDIEYIRILVDSSLLEIFINDGEYVITSRFYPKYTGDRQNLTVSFNCELAAITGWKMHTMETNRDLI